MQPYQSPSLFVGPTEALIPDLVSITRIVHGSRGESVIL